MFEAGCNFLLDFLCRFLAIERANIVKGLEVLLVFKLYLIRFSFFFNTVYNNVVAMWYSIVLHGACSWPVLYTWGPSALEENMSN